MCTYLVSCTWRFCAAAIFQSIVGLALTPTHTHSAHLCINLTQQKITRLASSASRHCTAALLLQDVSRAAGGGSAAGFAGSAKVAAKPGLERGADAKGGGRGQKTSRRRAMQQAEVRGAGHIMDAMKCSAVPDHTIIFVHHFCASLVFSTWLVCSFILLSLFQRLHGSPFLVCVKDYDDITLVFLLFLPRRKSQPPLACSVASGCSALAGSTWKPYCWASAQCCSTLTGSG